MVGARSSEISSGRNYMFAGKTRAEGSEWQKILYDKLFPYFFRFLLFRSRRFLSLSVSVRCARVIKCNSQSNTV